MSRNTFVHNGSPYTFFVYFAYSFSDEQDDANAGLTPDFFADRYWEAFMSVMRDKVRDKANEGAVQELKPSQCKLVAEYDSWYTKNSQKCAMLVIINCDQKKLIVYSATGENLFIDTNGDLNVSSSEHPDQPEYDFTYLFANGKDFTSTYKPPLKLFNFGEHYKDFYHRDKLNSKKFPFQDVPEVDFPD